MVKFIKFLYIICAFMCVRDLSLKPQNLYYDNTVVANDEVVYAKVLDECVLFKNEQMDLTLENIYFQVPESYFVVLLDTINEQCCKVQYGRYTGYVNSAKVEIAKFVPVVKTLDGITFDVKTNAGTQIWKYPTTNSTVFTTLDAGTKDITYIASVEGYVPSGGKSNIWYYVSYTPADNSTSVFEGYVYSENTTNLTEIVFNAETNPVDILEEESVSENIIFISSTLKTIVVTIIALPVILFFVIILYKIIKKFKKTTKYTKNNLKLDDENKDDFVKNQNIKSIEKYKNLRLVKNKNFSPNFDEYNDEDLL